MSYVAQWSDLPGVKVDSLESLHGKLKPWGRRKDEGSWMIREYHGRYHNSVIYRVNDGGEDWEVLVLFKK
jgi:hypothetical protein